MNRHQRRAATKASVAGGPSTAAALQFGIANHQAGRLAEAERLYREVLSYQPDNADALHLIGCIYMQTNRAEQGVASVLRAIAINPGNAEFFSNLAAGWSRLGKFEEAAEAYSRSVDLSATSATVFNDFGKVLEKLGKTAPALAAFAQAIIVDPMRSEAHANLGRMLQKFERYDDALKSFDAAVALAPKNAECLCHRSTLLYAMKRFDEALTSVDRAVALDPTFGEARNIRGSTLYRMGRYEDALASFDLAIGLNPNGTEIYLNRASALVDLHRFEEASADIEEAIRLKPDYAEAHNNGGLLNLLVGNFERGWIETEWRWQCPELKLKAPDFKQPLWLGQEPVAGQTLLLHSDQGLGDAIHFARYATKVAAMGARVLLAVDKPLVDILKTIDGVAECMDKDGALPAFDMHCPLSSLPLAFQTRIDKIPASVPYVRAPSSTKWRERLGEKTVPRVGLVWSGNPNHGNDHNRSLAFTQIAPLLDLPLAFYSLQKDIRNSDVRDFAGCDGIEPLGAELKDFADTAALLSELDLLITADTSIAHIAGAIGTATWILLPYTPDWRWLLDRDDSPWYPTVRLFRQSERRDWGSVMSRVRTSLQEQFACAKS
jgi:tetratricopeptide (TPR) repeat protein